VTYDGVNGVYEVTGTNTYVEAGSYAVSVTVEDSGGATVNASSAANVADVPILVQGKDVSVGEGAVYSGVIATFTDGNPGGVASEYKATINWGGRARVAGVDRVRPRWPFLHRLRV
jgi:hypothetical protein